MNFSVSSIIGGLIFGTIGFAAIRYGLKAAEWKPAVIGTVLMIFPYFVENVWVLYVVGILLTVSLFYFRD